MRDMTDNEIIKALECCGNIVDLTCKGCVYHETYNASCVVRLMRDALDLINRQKAEIKGLNELVSLSIDTQNEFSNKIAEQEAEIELLEAKNSELRTGLKVIKRTGIKRFAHQLKILLETKAKLYSLSDIDCEFAIVQSTALKTVDNLVKEMMEVEY